MVQNIRNVDTLADSIASFQSTGQAVQVRLSHALVRLLSEQLYQSPIKAIEELVVNAYDADAQVCRVFVPSPSDVDHPFIAVYDDGQGMDYDGLVNLWQVGRSNKRTDKIQQLSQRKQIGKFGIGKLATYTIAHQLTYITKTKREIFAVTIDFHQFTGDDLQNERPKSGKNVPAQDESNSELTLAANLPSTTIQPIELPVYKIIDTSSLKENTRFDTVFQKLGIDVVELNSQKSWTIVILENLKEKASSIKLGRLEWVLRTAMPLSVDFSLSLNNKIIESSKEGFGKPVSFNIDELPKERLEGLAKSTGENWESINGKIVSDSFPNGIAGHVYVTDRSLYGQKSDDIQRSHGFFVKVHNRLVDLVDPLFGMTPVRYGTLNNLHAEIVADDLDGYLTASRDTVEEGEVKDTFRAFLRSVFNEADKRYTDWEKAEKNGKRGKEGEKEVVAPKLVEHSVADALMIHNFDKRGAEADNTWFYIQLSEDIDIGNLAQRLYHQPRSKFSYVYIDQGTLGRLVKFDPAESIFTINSEHDLVKAYEGNTYSRKLLEDFVTAEMLLEVYLRESNLHPNIIGEVLTRRDSLLRSLVTDHANSLALIANNLRDSANNDNDLEINLVVAARALGFNATQISGPDKPDGLARYINYPNGEQLLTLEAKSSKDTPQLPAIQFAGLRRHVTAYNAVGCLLVAPDYPGRTKNNESAAAKEAVEQKISCWTVSNLARVVESAEKRHINAEDIVKIVTTAFTPDDVEAALNDLLSEPQWDRHELYQAIIEELRLLTGRLKDSPRHVDMVAVGISRNPNFPEIEKDTIKKAVENLAAASQGGMRLEVETERIFLTVDLEELERRVADLTKNDPKTRRVSNFRDTK